MHQHGLLDSKRFTKFCIIGTSSFFVSLIVFNLSYFITYRLVFSFTLAYIFSVINGFIWNRHWTFKDRRKHSFWNQATRFFIFYLIGYGMNLLVYASCLSLILKFQHDPNQPNHFYTLMVDILSGHAKKYSLLAINIACIFATGVTLFFNYMTSFFWTFKKE